MEPASRFALHSTAPGIPTRDSNTIRGIRMHTVRFPSYETSQEKPSELIFVPDIDDNKRSARSVESTCAGYLIQP